jgi:hypothetical protein
VPEVIDEGVTGFIVESIDEAVVALTQAVKLNRKAVRKRFEERFTASRMASNYVAAYEGLLQAPAITLPLDRVSDPRAWMPVVPTVPACATLPDGIARGPAIDPVQI